MHKFKYKPLKQHCFDFSYFCIFTHHQHTELNYLKTLAEWFRLASRIKKVQLFSYRSEKRLTDTTDLFRYMRDDLDKTNIEQVYNLTLFGYLWSAYEFLISNQDVNPQQQNIFELLKSKYEPHKNLVGYNDAVRELRNQFKYSRFLRSQHFNGPVIRPTRSTKGMYLIDPIRSYFAHLADHFPVGMDHEEKYLLENKIIKISSRIVLLTIQMILLAAAPANIDYIDNWWKSKTYRTRKSLHVFLRTVHLEPV